MAVSLGIDYDHFEIKPIIINDADGIEHEFNFIVRLIGEEFVLESFENTKEDIGGYNFSMIGNLEDGIFTLFAKLYDNMLDALNRKHIYRSTETYSWQIQSDENGKEIVRGRIESDIDSDDSPNTPLIIVDGKTLSWKDFGKTLMTFEGFNFKLQLFDPNDEMD